MKRLKHIVGMTFCGVSEILFLLAFACFAFGRWFTTDTKTNESAQ